MATRSAAFFQELRSRKDVVVEHRGGSFVSRVTTTNASDGTVGENFRLIHLASFSPITIFYNNALDDNNRGVPVRRIIDNFMNWDAAGFLAMIHFNQRNGSVIRELPERLKNCDLHLTMEYFDTSFSPSQASRQLYPLLFGQNHSFGDPKPAGVIGDVSSEVSKPLAVLTGLVGIPQISPSAASAYFEDQHTNAPSFARTMPGNRAYARATIKLLKFWNASHATLLYTLDEFGRSFLAATLSSAKRLGIILSVSAFDPSTANVTEAISTALDGLDDARYVISLLDPQQLEYTLVDASRRGLLSNKHQWISPNLGLFEPTYSLPKRRSILAQALNAFAVVDIHIPQAQPFVEQMAEFKQNPSLRKFYVESHREKELFDTYNWDASLPIYTSFAYTNYDAVIGMGISACEAPTKFFTPHEHYKQVTDTSYLGVSGHVRFDELTGSRLFEGLRYGFRNFLIDREASTNDTIRFSFDLTMILDASKSESERIQEIKPFIFRDGSTIPPPALPPLEFDQEIIPIGIRIFGWTLGCLAMLLTIALGLWTAVHRNKKMIRIAQPIFLGMMCAGTFLMAASVMFLGWQKPTDETFLDVSCMVMPWLLTLGFSTAFSALFTKIWRTNRLFKYAADLNRIDVLPKDVLWPFLLMTFTNIGLLLAWTKYSPLRWRRTNDGKAFDAFGRSSLSLGSCRMERGPTIPYSLVGFNFVMVVIANYQSYVGRNTPSGFNETVYVAMTMASLLECFLIGAPILFLAADNPSADFLVKSVLISVCCASILIPIYFNKFRVLHENIDTDNLTRAWYKYLKTTRRRVSFNDSKGHNNHSSNLDTSNPHDTVARIRASIKMRERIGSGLLEEGSSEFQGTQAKKRGSLAVVRSNSVRRSENESGKGLPHSTSRRSMLDLLELRDLVDSDSDG